ncbi:MAG: hypothetical protein EHM64_04115 [Ignavibacteriae bacterium]|nr:MAG: hypothetical protein EHM64_04115 [Ignavibacteriota bacterium]
MFQFDLSKIIQWISERWHRKSTLAIVLLLSLLILLSFAANLNLSKIEPLWWIVIVLVLGSIAFGWIWSTRIPRVSSDRVGFIVAINHEEKSKQGKFSNDFIKVLKELLYAGNLRYQFKVIELNEFHSSKIIDREMASDYLKVSRGHFLLYGNIKERPLNNQPHHFMSLSGIVAHRPIPAQVQQAFSKEFSELLPGKLAISAENDVFTFEFTAQLVEITAQYIIGIASLVSGNFQYAANLFMDLQTRIKSDDNNFPSIAKIKVRLPERLYQTYSVWMGNLYDLWFSTREKKLIEQIELLAQKILQIHPDDYGALLISAICTFLIRRDVKSAKRIIKKCDTHKEGTWLYSYAFLFAYEGNMKTATKLYLRAFKRTTERKDVQLQTEQFIVDVLGAEPNRIQLYYCLGLINYHSKQDLIAAARDFSQFLAVCPNGQFEEEKREARIYLETISDKNS